MVLYYYLTGFLSRTIVNFSAKLFVFPDLILNFLASDFRFKKLEIRKKSNSHMGGYRTGTLFCINKLHLCVK